MTGDISMVSHHPKNNDIYYPVNYGIILNITALYGKEQDAYNLGVDIPEWKFTGKVIAIIRRLENIKNK